MILEVAVLDVRPGSEGSFEAAFRQAASIIASMHDRTPPRGRRAHVNMMATGPRKRPTGRACAVIAAGALGFACALPADAWDTVPSASDLVTVESLGPSTVIPRADGAWVLYAPTLSVDCSPPRGCYANTQRIHYDFSCSGRYAVMTERISMDLNGNVVKHESIAASPGYAPSYDAGAIKILETFCPPLPTRD